MLKEIKCEQFTARIKGKTIQFKPGLNCVVGADDALNSIGKSSLLSMIDFCFGGNNYANQNSDIIKNVGNHIVCFTFEFNSQVYRFSRDTSDAGHYFECDDSYNPIGEKKPIDSLNSFLHDRYFGPAAVSSFRYLVGIFSRIYDKNNFDVKKPLKTYGDDTKAENGIKALIDLFGKMTLIAEMLKKIAQSKQAESAWKAADKFGVIYSPIKNASNVKSAKEEIERLRKEIESLVKDQDQAAVVAEEKLSQADIDLKSEQIFLMRQRRLVSIQLNSLESMTGENLLMTEEDARKLALVFPNIDLRPLSEINEFQRQLSLNVNEEIDEQRKSLENQLSQINNRLKEINDSLLQNNISPRISKTFLEAYQAKNNQIKTLERQIDIYEKKKGLKDKIANEKEQLNQEYSYVLSDIETSLNSELKNLNDKIYQEKRFSPQIKFNGFSSYEYSTPNDQGTGTEFKSLLLFDLVVLKLTMLPFAIEDSMLFKNLWDEPVEGLFRLYGESKKQVFIAIDRINVFDSEIQTIIKDHEIVRLGNDENTLFGRVWSKVSKK